MATSPILNLGHHARPAGQRQASRSLRIVRIAIVGVATSIGLTGCLLVAPDDVRPPKEGTSPSERAIYDHYLNAARTERDAGRGKIASVFAFKASSAAQGRPVAPETLNTWRPAHRVDELRSARARLTLSLSESQGRYAPTHAASATVLFDCWLIHSGDAEEAAEARRDACRDAFDDALRALDDQLENQ